MPIKVAPEHIYSKETLPEDYLEGKTEYWVSLELQDFPDYIISTFGGIYNIRHQRYIEGSLCGKYRRVSLKDVNEKMVFRLVHNLVMNCFNPNNTGTKLVVLHHQKPETNNNISNVYWGTTLERSRKQQYYKNVESKESICDDDEEWGSLDSQGFPYYLVSTHGKVFDIRRNCLVASHMNNGYMKVKIHRYDEKISKQSVHRLVMICFRPVERYHKLYIEHIHDKSDNNINNLCWKVQYSNPEEVVIELSDKNLLDNVRSQNEEWKSLEFLGYPTYIVSNHGNVKNVKYEKEGRELKGTMKNGYRVVTLMKKHCEQKPFAVHRLVLMCFKPNNTGDKLTVDHKDRVRDNNRLENLRWATAKEQVNNRIVKRKADKAHQYDMDGALVKIWESAKIASKYFDVHEETIAACCRGKTRTCCNFIWKYEKDVIPEEKQEWKLVPSQYIYGIENIYASSIGKVKLASGKITLGHEQDGYMNVTIKNDVVQKTVRVHRLVAIAFNEDQSINFSDFVVNHINGKKWDNVPTNLEFVTSAENTRHAFRTGLVDVTKQYRPVICLDKNTYKINTRFPSVKSAATALNIHDSGIRVACKNSNKTSGGYKWLYADDPKAIELINSAE